MRRPGGRQGVPTDSHLVFSNLKTWLNGIHHGVSAKRLQAYLNEFTFRFNKRFYPFNAFRSLLGLAGGATAPTYVSFTPVSSNTLDVVGVGVNRIGTRHSTLRSLSHCCHLGSIADDTC